MSFFFFNYDFLLIMVLIFIFRFFSVYEWVCYGEGMGWILLDDVDCVGWEILIFLCCYGGFGVYNCGYLEDVFVICY